MRLSLTTQLRVAKSPQQPPKPFPYFIFLLITYLLKYLLGTSLEVQWLRLLTPTAEGTGLIPGGGTKRGGHGNPLQYSCLENPHRQRSLGGYSPQGSQRVRHEWATQHRTAQRNRLNMLNGAAKKRSKKQWNAFSSPRVLFTVFHQLSAPLGQGFVSIWFTTVSSPGPRPIPRRYSGNTWLKWNPVRLKTRDSRRANDSPANDNSVVTFPWPWVIHSEMDT